MKTSIDPVLKFPFVSINLDLSVTKVKTSMTSVLKFPSVSINLVLSVTKVKVSVTSVFYFSDVSINLVLSTTKVKASATSVLATPRYITQYSRQYSCWEECSQASQQNQRLELDIMCTYNPCYLYIVVSLTRWWGNYLFLTTKSCRLVVISNTSCN